MANTPEEYKIRGMGITLTIPASKFDAIYQEMQTHDATLAYALNAVRYSVKTSGGDTMNLEFDLMGAVVDAARYTLLTPVEKDDQS